MSEETFIRILNDSATEAEKSSFYMELEKNGAMREQFLQFKNLYTVSTYQDTAGIKLSVDRFE